MSRLTNAIDNDFKALCLLRDEIALHASLLKADLKDRWNDLEQKLAVLREHLGRANVAAGRSRMELETSAQAMLESLRTGYADVKQALKH
jgi:hypothetical protein